MEVFTENLIMEFIGYDNDCEIESDTCSDNKTNIQKKKIAESRSALWGIWRKTNLRKPIMCSVSYFEYG